MDSVKERGLRDHGRIEYYEGREIRVPVYLQTDSFSFGIRQLETAGRGSGKHFTIRITDGKYPVQRRWIWETSGHCAVHGHSTVEQAKVVR